MGSTSSPASASLTRALTSTYFAVGFCGDLAAALYNVRYAGGRSSSSALSFFTASSIAYIVSFFVGALVPWPLSSLFKLGRKPLTFIGLTFVLLAAILATSIVYFQQVIACQVCYGLGFGVLYVTVILWRVETSEISRRGRDVVLLWIGAAAGTAVARWIRFGFSFVNSAEVSARLPLGIQIPVLLFAVSFVWSADESWRWLLQHNQIDKARVLLERYMSVDRSNPEFETTYAALLRHTRRTSTSGGLFPSKNTSNASPKLHPYRRLFLAFTLQTMRCLCGMPAANFYLSSATITIVGFNGSQYGLVAATPTITFLFTLIPYFLIDRPALSIFSPCSRRGLMIYGAVGLSAIFLLATIVAAATGSLSIEAWFIGNGMTLGAMIGFYVLFIFAHLFYKLGFGTVTDMYFAEIAASNTRIETVIITVAWGVAVEVAMGFAVGYGVPGLGSYFFLVWLVLNLVWATLIFLLYPETQGRSLEMLDGVFVRGLKVLAGTDVDARCGRSVGGGLVEFDDELVGGDGERVTAAES